MDDFETLSFEVLGRKVEPVEPKRDAETPPEPETVRRVRVGLDALAAELAEAKETVAYLEARENELLAEKAELARSLDETRARREEFAADARKAEIELRGKLADAERVADRWRVALDAALNDVDVYRRAAEWCGAAAIAAIAVAVVVF